VRGSGRAAARENCALSERLGVEVDKSSVLDVNGGEASNRASYSNACPLHDEHLLEEFFEPIALAWTQNQTNNEFLNYY
jgi:hypothetical protein